LRNGCQGDRAADARTPEVTYTYDEAGRLLTAANGVDTLTWSYNLAGDLLSEASTRAGTSLTYTYDSAGRRKSVSLDGVAPVSYGYDAGGRASTVSAGSQVFTFDYDKAARRRSFASPTA
jgi:YD repeat-containing protein